MPREAVIGNRVAFNGVITTQITSDGGNRSSRNDRWPTTAMKTMTTGWGRACCGGGAEDAAAEGEHG